MRKKAVKHERERRGSVQVLRLNLPLPDDVQRNSGRGWNVWPVLLLLLFSGTYAFVPQPSAAGSLYLTSTLCVPVCFSFLISEWWL